VSHAILDELKPEFEALQKIKDKRNDGFIELMKLLLTEKYWTKDMAKIEFNEAELTTHEKKKVKMQEFITKFHEDKQTDATLKEKTLRKRVS
jgi:hypothetical protein